MNETKRQVPLASPERLEKVHSVICTVGEILEAAYGTPDLGNTVDPLDELLYLLITQRTRIDLARRVYEDFRSKFHPWKKVLKTRSKQRLKRVLSVGGRGNLRYRAGRARGGVGWR